VSRPLLITDCDEVLLHMIGHFAEWVGEAHGLSFDISAPGFRNALLSRDGVPVSEEQVWPLLDQFFDTEMHRQNLVPGAADRLGLGADRLLTDYPRLIVCGISGYGTSGPYRSKKAYDLLVQCEVGVVAITGTPETPCKAGISVADLAGGMYAFTGILTALYQRERTGKGTALDVSLFDALGEWMGYPAYYTAYGGKQPARTGASNAVIAPYGPFSCGDGKTVFLGIQNSREWARFCEVVLEQPELTADVRFDSNPKRLANRQALHAIIDTCFAGLTAEAVIARLEQAGIANARLNSVQEFWDHPQLQERSRWREVDSEVGIIKALLPPVTMQQVEPRMDPIPRLGAHTQAILCSLGYDDAAIAQLRSERAI